MRASVSTAIGWSLCLAGLAAGHLTGAAVAASADRPQQSADAPQKLPAASPSRSPASEAMPAVHSDGIGRLVTLVQIDGQGPFRFMLDTGASRTVLALSTVQRLGLPLNEAARIPVIGVSGSSLVASVHLERLDAGAIHFKNVDLPVLTGPVFAGIDGILGMDGFRDKRIAADFRDGTFTISESHNLRAPRDYSVLPVEFVTQRLPMIEGRLGGVAVKAIIDTGGERTIGNLALLHALSARHDAGIYGAQTVVLDVTRNRLTGRLGMIWDARFGDARIANLVVVFGDFPVFADWHLHDQPALLIGMDVLGSLADLRLDYRRRELQIKAQSVPTVSMRY